MQRSLAPNLTLIAVAASYLVQVGAGFFALSTVGRVLISAPPRSLTMLAAPYGYDSSAFWEVAPTITALLFLLAIAANWRTPRRVLILGALVVFALSGAVTVGFIGPQFESVAAAGQGNTIDAALQAKAASWYAWDWGFRLIDAAASVVLLVALTRPVTRDAA